MQANGIADQFRGDHIALERLTDHKYSRYHPQRKPISPELKQPQSQRQRAADQRANIGNEGDQAGKCPDQQAKLQANQHQTDGVKCAHNQTNRALAANEG